MSGREAAEPLARIRRVLEQHSPEKIADREADRRAAVALVLRPPPGADLDRLPLEELLALFIRRAEAEGDPWSGHMGLPGGRSEPGDRDLSETARRETEEETGLLLRSGDILGRLSDLHPRSPHLPSVAITPYVARLTGDPEVTPNFEVHGHIWVPVRELWLPENRSNLIVERSGRRREFPTIEIRGRTIWGLTHEIVRRFLALVDEA